MEASDELIDVVLRGGPCDEEVLVGQPPVEFCPEYSELGWKYRRTGEVEQLQGDGAGRPARDLWIYEWIDE